MTKFKIGATFILAVCAIGGFVVILVFSVGEVRCKEGVYDWWLPFKGLMLFGGAFLAGLFAGRESLGGQLVDEYWEEGNREHIERWERELLVQLKRKYEE